MATATLKLAPAFLQSIVAQAIGSNGLRLGIIVDGNQIDENLIETTPNSIFNAEFNSAGWTRPSLTLPNNGSYDAIIDRWNFPNDLIWQITAPTGGLAIKQTFAIVGGSTTPRDSSGVLIGICTYDNPITIATGVTQEIRFDVNLFGVAS